MDELFWILCISMSLLPIFMAGMVCIWCISNCEKRRRRIHPEFDYEADYEVRPTYSELYRKYKMERFDTNLEIAKSLTDNTPQQLPPEIWLMIESYKKDG